MIVIPAIDLKQGACVRLKQGKMDETTVFSNRPEVIAEKWFNQGARRLHVVDLDGAFQGIPININSIREIVAKIDGKIPIQVGGGIREMETIKRYFDIGVSFVILGTVAAEKPELVIEACNLFPEKIIVGIDAKAGKVSVDGWVTQTDQSIFDLAKRYESYGVAAIIYTDISRDGMGSGINIEATGELAKQTSIPVIASGGLKSLSDIRKIYASRESGIKGVIAGRSLYEGDLDLRKAQNIFDGIGE